MTRLAYDSLTILRELFYTIFLFYTLAARSAIKNLEPPTPKSSRQQAIKTIHNIGHPPACPGTTPQDVSYEK
jgi:hypothetical protein